MKGHCFLFFHGSLFCFYGQKTKVFIYGNKSFYTTKQKFSGHKTKFLQVYWLLSVVYCTDACLVSNNYTLLSNNWTVRAVCLSVMVLFVSYL